METTVQPSHLVEDWAKIHINTGYFKSWTTGKTIDKNQTCNGNVEYYNSLGVLWSKRSISVRIISAFLAPRRLQMLCHSSNRQLELPYRIEL